MARHGSPRMSPRELPPTSTRPRILAAGAAVSLDGVNGDGPEDPEELLLRLRDVQRRVAALADVVEARGRASNGSSPPRPPRGARVVVVRSPPPPATRRPAPAPPAPEDDLAWAAPALGWERRAGGDRRQGPRDRRGRRRANPLLLAWVAQFVTFAALLGAVLASR